MRVRKENSEAGWRVCQDLITQDYRKGKNIVVGVGGEVSVMEITVSTFFRSFS